MLQHHARKENKSFLVLFFKKELLSSFIGREVIEMAAVRLWTDADVAADARVSAVFAEIRAARQSDFVNNFWRALANQPEVLERTWSTLKSVMAPGALDPLVKEMIYIAVSTANGCSYCIHSHTASARAKGLTEAQHGELLSVIGMASETNALATAMQIDVDPAFLIGAGGTVL